MTTDINIPPEEFNAIANKIPSVPNTAFAATVVPVPAPSPDFMSTSKAFWNTFDNGKYAMTYNTGVIAGTYNTQRATLDCLFGFFIGALRKHAITMSTIEDVKTTDLDLYFKNLEISHQLLRDKFEGLFKNDVDGIEILSYIHGTINKFVNQNINKG
jgi:hypothetical protein